MTIKIKVQNAAPTPSVSISPLTGTRRRLAKLVSEHATYEHEGFKWLLGTFGGIAEHLRMHEKTIARCAATPPFHYITRLTPDHGKHILLKLGTEPCETDLVFRLRAVWVRGLAYFNEAAAKAWPIEAMKAKHAKMAYEKLLKRTAEAEKWAPALEKLKAGERISYTVKDHEMGLLRECVKRLGNDAFDVIACLTSWNGWHLFISYVKYADRGLRHHYHWPTLGPIASNPDIALQAYLDIRQEEAKIDIPEGTRLNAKIASLTVELTA